MSSKQSTIRGLILDMDGVLWRENTPIGNLASIFSRVHDKQYGVVLATNNATLSVRQYLQKLKSFGVALEQWQIVNSSQAVGHYLRNRHPGGGSVYLLGEDGLAEELDKYGFHPSENEVLAVVVGLDRGLTYDKLANASRLISRGAPFIGTNPDLTFPTPQGLVPGAGAILAAVQAATGIKPVIVGKPAPEMYQVALERMGISAPEALVVGDRLETDIAGAQGLGCKAALVLSGVTAEAKAVAWRPAPDFIEKDLESLLNHL
jgi:4-nitrophenyl phosphatase